MATNAERQAAFRQRRIIDGDLERLNTTVGTHTKRALERLAHRYGVTQRHLLERLIQQAENTCLKRLPPEQHEDYFEKRPQRPPRRKTTKISDSA